MPFYNCPGYDCPRYGFSGYEGLGYNGLGRHCVQPLLGLGGRLLCHQCFQLRAAHHIHVPMAGMTVFNLLANDFLGLGG